MFSISIQSGTDKKGHSENFTSIQLNSGELCTIVGNTGSGKSQLIKDIEQLVTNDSISHRTILLNKKQVDISERFYLSNSLVAHLSQNMQFVLDKDVESFLSLHAKCRGIQSLNIDQIIDTANTITPEPIHKSQNLNNLSGGQSRALMIADISCICDSPIVLIDEIENAGITKTKALNLLLDKNKLVLIVTHDIHTALMGEKRIIMENGGIKKVLNRTKQEFQIFKELEEEYHLQLERQDLLRKGESIV